MATTLHLAAAYVDEARASSITDRPLLINRSPSPDETGAPRQGTISLEIVDLQQPPAGIDQGNTLVYINGELAWDDDAAEAGFDGPLESSSSSAAYYRITLDPTTAFDSEEVVEVRVVTRTIDAVILDETYSFTIEDYRAPRLVAASATGPKEVTLSFDEDVEVSDSSGFVFSRASAPAVDIEATWAESNGSAIVVTLDTEMTPGASYEVAATGAEDLSGNAVSSPYDSATFDGFTPQAPPTRRFVLWDFIPYVNKLQDVTGDLRALIDIFQEIVDLLLGDIDGFADIWSIDRAPSSFLDLMLSELGNPFSFDLTDTRKRRLAATLVDLYQLNGTAAGLTAAINFFVGVLVEVLSLREIGLSLGESELSWPAYDISAAAPFDTEDGRTLIFNVNDEDPQTLTINAADVVDIDAVTADELAGLITSEIVGAVAYALDDDTVRVQTFDEGPASSLQVSGGTAAADFGFSGDASVGGGDWVLGASGRRALYTFQIISPLELTDEQREQITTLAEYMKPAHTHFAGIIEPETIEIPDDWLLDVSLLSETTVLS
ncbi:MAG: Ig-like domain-containing protein [Gammaproteobacteria bacterium]|nr:Ig-like domain-containing protein [Gammaproteobacteria bacterium]